MTRPTFDEAWWADFRAQWSATFLPMFEWFMVRPWALALLTLFTAAVIVMGFLGV